jgi:hypothetical protein
MPETPSPNTGYNWPQLIRDVLLRFKGTAGMIIFVNLLFIFLAGPIMTHLFSLQESARRLAAEWAALLAILVTVAALVYWVGHHIWLYIRGTRRGP